MMNWYKKIEEKQNHLHISCNIDSIVAFSLICLNQSISPGQNGSEFAEIYFREWKTRKMIKISLKFVHKCLIDNNPALA